MSTPYEYITQTGAVVADTSDILTQVQSEWQQAFGTGLDVDDSTPQGVMINAETATRVSVAQANAKLANQINPNIASGLFLDALCALLGLYRAAATPTQVTNVMLSGVVNTPIPAGSRATLGPGGTIFTLQTGVILANNGSGGGVGYGTFVCSITGPVACASGALNTPYDTVLGWETITNNQSGTPASVTTLGTLQQSDASLRALRNNTLALQGISTPQAQISNLYAIPGVTSVAYLENVTNATVVINGVTLVAHSVWACVDGTATALQIATSLLNNKTDGAGWNGAQSVPVLEPASGQTYTVLFDFPTYVFIYGAMTIRQGTYSGTLQADAAQAVANYFVGLVDGFTAVGIGQNVSPFEIAAAVVSACPGCIVMGCSIGTVPGTLNPADITINQNQRAQTNNTAFIITVTA
jgi:uncharacterized phage protein gp47/JayE